MQLYYFYLSNCWLLFLLFFYIILLLDILIVLLHRYMMHLHVYLIKQRTIFDKVLFCPNYFKFKNKQYHIKIDIIYFNKAQNWLCQLQKFRSFIILFRASKMSHYWNFFRNFSKAWTFLSCSTYSITGNIERNLASTPFSHI